MASSPLKINLFKRLENLKALKPDWNGENELPIRERSYRNVKDAILATNSSMLSGWILFPAPNGSLYFAGPGKSKAGISIGDDEMTYSVRSSKGTLNGKKAFSKENFINIISSINSLINE